MPAASSVTATSCAPAGLGAAAQPDTTLPRPALLIPAAVLLLAASKGTAPVEGAGSRGGLSVLLASAAAALGAWCLLAWLAPRWPLFRSLVTALQRLAAARARAQGKQPPEVASWMNMGYWKEAEGYDAACRQLATLVGDAAGLQSGDRVLCVACGSGDEVRHFRRRYSLGRSVGIDADALAVESFKPECQGESVICGDVHDLLRGTGTFRRGDFDKVVAVDSVYHLEKASILHDCAQLVQPGGGIAFSDVVLRPSAPFWIRRLLLPALGIRPANQWLEQDYSRRLATAGFELTALRSLEPHVIGHWFPAAITRHLDYVLVSAVTGRRAGLNTTSAPPRPRVAVVGSGLSGLVVAHLLEKSHDVTIFEARPEPGFAGNEARLGPGRGEVVDIPLRMISPYYWRRVVALCRELNVPLRGTNFTVCLYGTPDEGGSSKTAGAAVKTEETFLGSVLSNARHYFQLGFSLLTLLVVRPREGETVRAFAERVGLAGSKLYHTYALMNFSWILSCTYPMVEGYPAQLVLGFIRATEGINLFAGLCRRRRCGDGETTSSTLRVAPSVKSLEDALLAGREVLTSHPVPPFTEQAASGPHTIGGRQFDKVVLATEASAVSKIVPRSWTSIFDEFQYINTWVVVHRDASLMPADRADWRALNVHDGRDAQGGGEDGCQITVWVNEYYRDVDCGGDVFETVNPRHRPREELIIKELRLPRVVHTTAYKRLQESISQVQGREGFYFCGAYAAPGLGLLEQACHSAQLAADAILRDLGPGAPTS